jgi:Zn-dependent peptidase ImmA (M78 family)
MAVDDFVMQPPEEFSTLVHEIAHEVLHRGERRTMTTKRVQETEAASFSASPL